MLLIVYLAGTRNYNRFQNSGQSRHNPFNTFNRKIITHFITIELKVPRPVNQISGIYENTKPFYVKFIKKNKQKKINDC